MPVRKSESMDMLGREETTHHEDGMELEGAREKDKGS